MEKEGKGDAAVISVSGIGMRSYARGRAYDPNRYSPDGPTPYHDPDRDWDEAKKAEQQPQEKKGFFGRRKKSTDGAAPVEPSGDTVTPEGKRTAAPENQAEPAEPPVPENEEKE